MQVVICGNNPFTFCYALDCKKGGLVTQCHNEISDALDDLVNNGIQGSAVINNCYKSRQTTKQTPGFAKVG